MYDIDLGRTQRPKKLWNPSFDTLIASLFQNLFVVSNQALLQPFAPNGSALYQGSSDCLIDSSIESSEAPSFVEINFNIADNVENFLNAQALDFLITN